MITPPDELCKWILKISEKIANQRRDIPIVAALLKVLSKEEKGLLFYENNYFWKIEALSSNLVKKKAHVLFHAEFNVINKIKNKDERLYLNEYYLISNLEPCLFCYSALVLHRIKAIYYYVKRDKGISALDIYELSLNRKMNKSKKILNHNIPLIHLEKYNNEQKKILQNFFSEIRSHKKKM